MMGWVLFLAMAVLGVFGIAFFSVHAWYSRRDPQLVMFAIALWAIWTATAVALGGYGWSLAHGA